MYLHVWRVHKSHTTVVEHTQPYNMHKEHDCSRSIHHAIIFLFQIPNAWQKCTQFYACAWQIDLCVRWASSILQTSAWAIAALIKLCATLMMLSDNQPVVKSMHAFISVIFCLSVKLQKAVNILFCLCIHWTWAGESVLPIEGVIHAHRHAWMYCVSHSWLCMIAECPASCIQAFSHDCMQCAYTISTIVLWWPCKSQTNNGKTLHHHSYNMVLLLQQVLV